MLGKMLGIKLCNLLGFLLGNMLGIILLVKRKRSQSDASGNEKLYMTEEFEKKMSVDWYLQSQLSEQLLKGESG